MTMQTTPAMIRSSIMGIPSPFKLCRDWRDIIARLYDRQPFKHDSYKVPLLAHKDTAPESSGCVSSFIRPTKQPSPL